MGPASVGKTAWMCRVFADKRVYLRQGDSKYPFDSFYGERVIVYDDVTPRMEELLYVSNTYTMRVRVYGPTRYTDRWFEKNSSRILVVLTNKTPEECYFKDEKDKLRLEAFYTRFNII